MQRLKPVFQIDPIAARSLPPLWGHPAMIACIEDHPELIEAIPTHIAARVLDTHRQARAPSQLPLLLGEESSESLAVFCAAPRA